MTITVSRAALVGPLNAAASLVDGKIIPILGCVRLDAVDDTLTIRATNMSIWLTQTVRLEDTVQPVSLCIAASRLADFVRRLPDTALIDLTPGKQACRIVSGESRYSLPTLDPIEYPILENHKVAHTFSMSAESLLEMLSKVRYCASADEARQSLAGVHLCASQEREEDAAFLCVEASDGHRLARQTATAIEGLSPELDAVLPRKAVDYLLKVLAGKTGPARLDVSLDLVALTLETVSCHLKLIDATFPDCDRLIPRSHTSSISVAKAPLQKAIERLSLLHSDREFLKRFVAVQAKAGIVSFSVKDQTGEGAESLRAEIVGDPEDFGINPRYLLDTLSHIAGESVTLEMNGALAAIVFRDSADITATHIVMPQRA